MFSELSGVFPITDLISNVEYLWAKERHLAHEFLEAVFPPTEMEN